MTNSLFPNGSLTCWIKPARFWRTDVAFGCQIGSRFTSGGSWRGSPKSSGTTRSGNIARAPFTVRDFCRFQDAICRLGIEESWYRFEEQALEEIAREWSEAKHPS